MFLKNIFNTCLFCLIIIGFVSLLLSCNDTTSYKKFSLKGVLSSDSSKNYADSITLFRKSINADEKEKALEKLFDEKAKWNRFNGAVLIVQQGYVLFKKAYGFANYKQNITINTQTSFQLASTSKTFTACAIMLLQQQGKLNYSDDVKKHIPNFPYDGITIKLLLSHRSGLPNYMYFAYCYINNYTPPFNNDQLVQMMINEKPPIYSKPNKRFSYCNTNYALLAVIIEKVSGMSYPNFMHDYIFSPLKMENTWVNTAENSLAYTNKTIAYSGNFKVEENDFLDGIYGDKNIYSNVEDLYKWDQSLYNQTLLKAETLEEAFTGKSKERKGINNYGYGFRILNNKNGSKVVYHNGWWHCYTTTFYRELNTKICIIILSNKYNKTVYHISDILNILSISPSINGVELE